MSRVDDMATFAEENGPITIDDLLTQLDFIDPAKRASAKAQFGRELEQGGRYRRLAEQHIVMPSLKTSGRSREARWERGLKRASNTLPVILRSDALAKVRGLDLSRHSAQSQQAIQAAIGTNVTGRKGETMAAAIVDLAHENELMRTRLEGEQAISKERRERVEELTDIVKTLQSLIPSHGNGLVRSE
jgi:hypothetical protein